jgi:hypothetical protein
MNICPDHSGHIARLKQCEDNCAQNTIEHHELENAIDNKVNLSLFMLLVTLFAGSLAWQFSIYDKQTEVLSQISRDVAAIKAEIRYEHSN